MPPAPKTERLQKLLSNLGITSRRDAEKWILDGRIEVNGTVITELGTRVDPDKDKVSVDGTRISTRPKFHYIMLNKPEHIMTTRRDDRSRPTIYHLRSLKNSPIQLSSVGRLDFDTDGLLLLSNDGELVHRLMHPKYEVERCYRVKISRQLSQEELNKLRTGIRLRDGLARVQRVKLAKKNPSSFIYELTVTEGRNRLIRRIFEALRRPVLKLTRIAYANIQLPRELRHGEVCTLTPKQVHVLKGIVGLTQSSLKKP